MSGKQTDYIFYCDGFSYNIFVINKYTEDFDRTPNRVSWIKMTQYSNNGNLYNIIPKEILFDSTENQTGKFMAKKDGDGPRRNINDTDQSTSILGGHTLNYQYNPFMNRTFGAEELENEKFTGTQEFIFITHKIIKTNWGQYNTSVLFQCKPIVNNLRVW